MAIALKRGTDGGLVQFQTSDTLEVDAIDLLSATGTLAIGASMGSADSIEIGSATCPVAVLEDLDVDGNLTISGSAGISFADTDVQIIRESGHLKIKDVDISTATAIATVETVKRDFYILDTSLGGSCVFWSNNDMASIRFHNTLYSYSTHARRFPSNYVSGDIKVRLICSVESTIPANRYLAIGKFYKFLDETDALGTYTSSFSYINIGGTSADTQFVIELTIPSSDVDSSKDLLYFAIARAANDAGDTVDSYLHVHSAYLQYNGVKHIGYVE